MNSKKRTTRKPNPQVLREDSPPYRVNGNGYERCLRGKFASQLAKPLLLQLAAGFKAEFPQTSGVTAFLVERGYDKLNVDPFWQSLTDALTNG